MLCFLEVIERIKQRLHNTSARNIQSIFEECVYDTPYVLNMYTHACPHYLSKCIHTHKSLKCIHVYSMAYILGSYAAYVWHSLLVPILAVCVYFHNCRVGVDYYTLLYTIVDKQVRMYMCTLVGNVSCMQMFVCRSQLRFRII